MFVLHWICSCGGLHGAAGVRAGKTERLVWDDVKVACGEHDRQIDYYTNKKK